MGGPAPPAPCLPPLRLPSLPAAAEAPGEPHTTVLVPVTGTGDFPSHSLPAHSLLASAKGAPDMAILSRNGSLGGLPRPLLLRQLSQLAISHPLHCITS